MSSESFATQTRERVAAPILARAGGTRRRATTANDSIHRQLRRAPGLAGFSDAAIRDLARAGRIRTLRRGHRLFSEGEPATNVFVVLSGTLAIQRETEPGGVAPIALRSAGEWIGELALLDAGARSATVVADSNAVLFELSRSAFESLLATEPRVALELAATLARRLRESDAALIDTLRKSNAALARENRSLRSSVSEEARAEAADRSFFPGPSAAAARIRSLVRRAARSGRPVLVVGEPGTPKASLAHAIHARSDRAEEALLGVDCRRVAQAALEQELFGVAHAGDRGAAPGALAAAGDGAVVLTSVEALSPWLQGTLLRFLERGEYMRTGSARVLCANARVFATSEGDLDALVRSGHFRPDLLDALRGFEITIPPLRTRRSDLPELIDAILEPADGPRLRLDRSGSRALVRHGFLRNEEELREILAELAEIHGPDAELTAREVVSHLALRKDHWPDAYSEAMSAFRTQHLRQALERADGNQAEAARILGLHPANLHRMLRALGLKPRTK